MRGSYLGPSFNDNDIERSLTSLGAIYEKFSEEKLLKITQKKERYTKLPEKGIFIFTGAIIGLFSTILGIGGGTLTVPILLWLNHHMRTAVATSSACSIPIALVATITFIFVSWDNSNIFIHSIGYLYWPAALIIVMMTIFFAPIGARLAHYLPIEILKRIFAVLLMFIGIKMLI